MTIPIKRAPDGSLRVRVRKTTAAKWLAIAHSRRWTLAETADALADAYLTDNPAIIRQAGLHLPDDDGEPVR